MKLLDELETTSNQQLHRRLYRKVYISNQFGKCSYCPLHSRENAGPHRYKRKKKEFELSKAKRRGVGGW